MSSKAVVEHKRVLSDEETRKKRAEDLRRKRGDRNKPLTPKPVDPRKEEYRRKRLDPKNLGEYYDNEYDGEED